MVNTVCEYYYFYFHTTAQFDNTLSVTATIMVEHDAQWGVICMYLLLLQLDITRILQYVGK